MDPGEVLDEALVRLGGYGPEFRGGLSNHGPMVVESLVRLGRADAVGPWVDGYVGRLEPAVEPSGRAPTLGEIATFGDWEQRFSGELADAPWREVLNRWLPRLLPGVMAAATHGWLRTAHAARALLENDTPARRAELARGLAYWAARYQELPGPMRPSGTASLVAAVASLPARGGDGPGLIFERVRALWGDAEFVAAVDSAAPAELTADGLLAAAASLIRSGDAEAPIVYVHTLTPTAAVRSLAPALDSSTVPLALGCAWRAVAALIATYPVAGHDVGTPEDVDVDDVVDRAVVGGDEHAIKVAEAAFGPDAAPDPAVRAAAAALVAKLQPTA